MALRATFRPLLPVIQRFQGVRCSLSGEIRRETSPWVPSAAIHAPSDGMWVQAERSCCTLVPAGAAGAAADGRRGAARAFGTAADGTGLLSLGGVAMSEMTAFQGLKLLGRGDTLFSLSANATLREAVAVMVRNRVGSLIVSNDEGHVTGLVVRARTAL